MSAPTKRLTGFRIIPVRYGDTLPGIAARELGDAALWVDLVAINDLVDPYVTGDPNLAGPKVLLYGGNLIVPAQASETLNEADAARVFKVDIKLTNGRLTADDKGDLAVVSGLENFKQALSNRLATPLHELIRHWNYGCEAHALKGQGGLGGIPALGAGFVRSACEADRRTASVDSATATIEGDAITIIASVQPIQGPTVDVGISI